MIFSVIGFLYYLYYHKKTFTNLCFLSGVLLFNGVLFFLEIFLFAIFINIIIFFIYNVFIRIKTIDFIIFMISYLLIVIVYCLGFIYSLEMLKKINFHLAIALVFGILHYQNRVSISFFGLFFGFLMGMGYLANSNLIINYIIVAVVFLLANNNQKFMRKDYEQRVIEYQNVLLKQQVDEVQSVYLIMRGWRHDYHNHLQALKAHLSLKQYDSAGKYLNNLEIDLNSIDTIVQSGNIQLDAILNSKLSLASVKDINVNIKASVPEKLFVSDIDICVVIGNLIDNAIEACEVITNEKKFIRIYLGVFQKQLYISVTNSTKELVRKLDHEYITNKRGNHGHGLKRIDLIVEKYGGYINRKNEPGVFVTEIMLPL